MPPTTGYSFGDVVLVPFPFTDQSGIKRRPAVIVSSAQYQARQAASWKITPRA
jgi:mRNA interferase MazF